MAVALTSRARFTSTRRLGASASSTVAAFIIGAGRA